jgi:hypothetical protein
MNEKMLSGKKLKKEEIEELTHPLKVCLSIPEGLGYT